MVKKVFVLVVLAVFLIHGTAFAMETGGDVVFKDTMYGAIVGAIIGGAVYLVDDENLGQKMGVGIGIGALGGLIYGLSETRSLVSIDKDKKVMIAVPAPVIQKTKDATKMSISLLKIDF